MDGKERFQVDLRGIIELLGQHLYSSPEVFVRELLQNAVDAHTARQAVEPAHLGKVRLELTTPKAGPPTLTVEDDGIGLTAEDMQAFLATIGASSKRGGKVKRNEGFLGQFGIGLLSCFMVSDEIRVISQAVREGSRPIEWSGQATGTYTIREVRRTLSPGTRVYLQAKAGCEELLTFDRLVSLARQYGEMLPVEISVAEGKRLTRINRDPSPWSLRDNPRSRKALDRYCAEALGFSPLDVIGLHHKESGLSGLAFVVPQAVPATAHGGHRVYQRGMFVSDEVKGLVPDWAFFVRCVINTTDLELTASREDFCQNKALERASEQIGAALRDHLVRMARQKPDRFAEFMAVHETSVRALAVDDDDFFDVVIDLLPFETSLGEMTLGQYRRENTTLRVAPTNDQFRQMASIAAAQSVCVFNGGYTYHTELLRKAAVRFSDMEWQLTSAADLVLEFEELTDQEQESIFDFLQTADRVLAPFQCRAEVRRFEPATVPALYASDLGAVLYRSIERTRELADSHWGEVLSSLRRNRPAPRVELCFNYACTLVQRIAGLPDERLQEQAIRLLYVQALLLGQHGLSHRELSVMADSMDALLRFAVERA